MRLLIITCLSLINIFISSTTFAAGGLTWATATTWNFSSTSLESDWLTTFAGGTDNHSGCETVPSKDKWYKFTATQSDYYFIVSGNNADFRYALYTESGGVLTQFSTACYLVGNSNAWHYYNTLVNGTTYYIKVMSASLATTYSIGLSKYPFAWTGFWNTDVTEARNYAGNSAPGVASAVYVSSKAYNTYSITANANYDIGSLTIEANSSASVAIAAQSTLRTIDIDNLTLNASSTFTINHSHATYGLEIDVQDFTANSSSTLTINDCNNNFKFITRDIVINANANITFPDKGVAKEYTVSSSRAINIASLGQLTFQDYVSLTATDVTVDGTLRFDHVAGSQPIIAGNFTVNGTLNHQGHRYISLTGIGKTISGTGNFYGGTSSPIVVESGASYTFGSLASNTIRLSHLCVVSGGSISIGANTVNTCYFIQNGNFYQNSGVLGIAGPTSYTMSSGKYNGNTWISYGFVTNPGITNANFDEGTGTTYFNSGDYTNADMFFVNNQTVPSVTYNNLKVRTNNGYVATLGTGSNVTVNGDLSLINPGTAGGVATTNWTVKVGADIYIGSLNGVNPSGNALTLNCAHAIYRSSGTGSFTMGNNASHAINISYLDPSGTGDECFYGFGIPTFYGTVNYSGAGNQEILPATFNNLTISGSGIKTALSNNSIKGNWTNNIGTSAFAGSTYKVTFNGSSAQSITGSYGTTFNKLEVNNSLNVDIIKNAVVSSWVDFTLGDFVASDVTQPLTFGSAATINTVASDNSHVVGYVAKNTSSTTEFTFPCGDGTYYRLCSVKPSDATARTYRVKYFGTAYSDLTTSGINHVTNREYWDIASVSGTKNALVKLSWGLNSGINSTYLDLKNAFYNGTDWIEVTGAYTHTGNSSAGTLVSSTDQTSFGYYTLGSSTSANLPVELLDFSAKCDNDKVLISWITSSETNNNFFTIEKSDDLIDFKTVALVNGAGNSNSIKEYQLVDELSNKLSYYRLKQTDFDGKFELFSPVSVKCNDINEVLIYFNSEDKSIRIENLSNSEKNVQVYNSEGRLISNQKTSDNKNIRIITDQFSSGVYLVMLLVGNDEVITRKIIIN
ncbi:MAG: T9SS type A sorting domain-containing protein [Bacteroidota bacterium]